MNGSNSDAMGGFVFQENREMKKLHHKNTTFPNPSRSRLWECLGPLVSRNRQGLNEYVRCTCCYEPVLKIQAHTLGVGGSPHLNKQNLFDEDHVMTRHCYETLQPSMFT